MAPRSEAHPGLTALPMLPHESIYIGVDVGKFKHVAGFVSKTLLDRHKHCEHCPAFIFEQSREGFRAFVARIGAICPLEHCFIVMEQTGHYHRPLVQYLLELDLAVYVIHVQSRDEGMLKTDKRDALRLANHLYNQLALGVQVANKLQVIRRAVPPSEAAAHLKGLMRHRYEVVNESTQRKNKLTAICDELFPEFTQVFKNPNLPIALDLRQQFPTPQAVAAASLAALRQVRKRNHPSEAQLARLQSLAAQSIGTKDLARQRGLLLEPELLSKELRLIQDHLERLEGESCQIVAPCREGKILLSLPPITPLAAATMLASIGHIANFENAGRLKSYFGWAPKRSQTGVTFDRTRLTPGGSREMKRVMYLVAWNAIREGTEWASLYQRLVPRLCSYDERAQAYTGKGKAIGHVIGRLITLIYALLRQDHETLSQLAPGIPPPEPLLYEREVHQLHRTGHYQPHRKKLQPNQIVHLQP
jgi:transposase